jgi:hypothetical protein
MSTNTELLGQKVKPETKKAIEIEYIKSVFWVH